MMRICGGSSCSGMAMGAAAVMARMTAITAP
jgi:hypothetical protein